MLLREPPNELLRELLENELLELLKRVLLDEPFLNDEVRLSLVKVLPTVRVLGLWMAWSRELLPR
jgi:hypothetical protein